MNILIVTAHPSPTGVTNSIAKIYAESKQSKKHEVKIVDLYSDEYKIDLLKFTNIREFTPSKTQLKFQDQILWAHEIVVVHPIWWGTPPSIMKSWVELTFWPHVAYKYNETGKIEKLLTGKTAKIFATCGGPSWWYYLPFLPLRSFWGTSVFNFCGVDITSMQICGNLDKWKNEKRTKHIENFLRKIKKD